MDAWYKSFFSEDYWRYARSEYAGPRTQREVEYLLGVLESRLPGRRVVDLGCGIGRHAIPLARAGFEVVGVDVSEWVTGEAARAASQAGATARFETADLLVQLPRSLGQFDAAISVQAFGWGSDAAQLRMLKEVRRHLVPGGLLVLDFSSLLWMLANYEEKAEADVDGTRFTFVRSYDPLSGRSRGRVEVTPDGGGEIVLEDDVRLYSPAEMVALVRAAGFDVERVDADFVAGAEITRATRYGQVIARAVPVPPKALGLATLGPVDPGPRLDLRWALDEGEWLSPTPSQVWEAMVDGSARELAETARHYALDDPYGSDRAADAVSAHFGCEVAGSQIVFGAGVSALLRHACHLAEGGAVAVTPFSHPDLPAWASALGCEIRVVDASLEQTVSDEAPALVSIDRPAIDGQAPSLDEVSSLAQACAEQGATLVVDESYANYLEPGVSAVRLTATVENLVVLRGFSKAYSWGGLRVGLAVCSPDEAERLRESVPPLQVSELSLAMALHLLAAGDAAAPLRARVEAVQPGMVAALEGAGLEVLGGHAALPWVLVPDEGGVASRILEERGVLPKRLLLPGQRPLLRLSVPLSEERVGRFHELLP